ncbi:proprotein convertase P-domain-containing protein [Streptomyces sp. MRC013]|uniref:proprotein convertase P-domain-containing protein n=1 Tax=Streptomyces sp. MRC013 TaxID=2898276 RepID=UPI0020267999|nr:proprotein convertase P-domain-containing protein [Streptomyces sp. MRC013]URM92406.1 proprotein convertase P-domain-containing protein [Streptomyces sp. MRC013]
MTTASATAFAAQAAPSPKPAAPAPQATAPAAAVPSAPVEKVIVTYGARTAEATSSTAAKGDTAEKAAQAGEALSCERRLAGGPALVDLGAATTEQDVAKVMAAFRADPAVASVEADVRAYPMAVAPDDTDYAEQWDPFEPTGGVNVPGAWDRATGSGVTVAVVDTGYAARTDLAANTVAGYDFISSSTDARDGGGRDGNPKDEGDWNATGGECGAGSRASDSSWHGTRVAGAIGAVTHNAKGAAGIADAAKTVDAVLGDAAFTDSADVTIVDNATATATSPVAVTGVTGDAPATLKANVDIKHTWRGDLVIDLVAPDGTAHRPKNSDSGDSADNVLATSTANASSEVANGTWKLQVRDIASGDTGYTNSWGLTF